MPDQEPSAVSNLRSTFTLISSGSRERRVVYGLVFLALLDIASRLLSNSTLETTSAPVWAAYAVTAAVLAGKRLGSLTLSAALVSAVLLHFASKVKIQLTEMPVTFDDIVIAASNPEGLWQAIGAPPWLGGLVYVLLALLALLFLVTFFHGFRRILRGGHALPTLGLCCLALMAFTASLSGFSGRVYSVVDRSDLAEDLWWPRADSQLAEHIGNISYLNYSYRKYQGTKRGDIFDIESPVSPGEPVRNRSPLAFKAAGGKRGDPNIVFILLESAFDIGKAFELSAKDETPLLVANKYTKLLAPLRVNAIGGGTWLTEFETITGVDSRVFGHYGAYTHSNVSPFIRSSLASHLSDRGYSTSAMYPVSGGFFNARNAYRNYGFDKFNDAGDLGLSPKWREVKDTRIVEAAIAAFGTDSSKPLFAYLLTLQNHSPHPCTEATPAGQVPVKLTKAPGFPGNCSINEYLSRMQSTSNSVFAMLSHLEALERDSGRPFVLVVFGDHEPHTFTSTGDAQFDFSPFRTSKPKNETFVHIMSSVSGRFEWGTGPVPAFLLPSLVTSMLGTQPTDTYLGENFSVFAECGPDIIAAYKTADGKTSRANEKCRKAYPQVLERYRRDIVNLGSGS